MRLSSLVILVAALTGPSLAQKPAPTLQTTFKELSAKFGTGFWRYPISTKFGLEWASLPFERTSKFRNARIELESQFRASKADTLELVKKAREVALPHQKNQLLLFKWAYASYLQARVESQKGASYWGNRDRVVEKSMLNWLMADSGPQADYDFVRVRFILEAGWDYRPDLLPLGRRLVKEGGDNNDIWRVIAYQLGHSSKESELKEGMSIVDKLLSEEPKRLSYLGLKSFILETRWMRLGRKPEDARKVIESHRKFMAVAPKGAPNRDVAQQQIDYFTKVLKEG